MPEEQLPWEKAGVEFDPEKGIEYIKSLKKDVANLQERLREKTASSSTKSTEKVKKLERENLLLRVRLDTGLTEKQVNRLVGDNYDALIEDAKAYAEESGIELPGLNDGEDGDEGTPDGQGSQDASGAGESEQQPVRQVQSNLRAPAAPKPSPREDFSKVVAALDID